MSDTDKTKPSWVKLRQNPEWRKEDHDHRNGVCDLQFRETYRYVFSRGCYYVRRNSTRGFWPRSSKAEQTYRNEANGKARTTLRAHIRDLLKTNLEDLEYDEYQSFPHRHQALWDSE